MLREQLLRLQRDMQQQGGLYIKSARIVLFIIDLELESDAPGVILRGNAQS